MSAGRPDFSNKMTVEDFEQYYWYKEELVQLCCQCGLSAHGTKAELEQRIKRFLTGNELRDERKTYSIFRKKQTAKEITLETRLIPDGFKFNQQARSFFAEYYGVKKFSFTKEMAAALREAERRGDYEMTEADLLKVYEDSLSNSKRQTAEDKTYQWNQFVKDFNADQQTRGMKNRMKVAALLWKHVREQPGLKVYKPTLLERYGEEIKDIADDK